MNVSDISTVILRLLLKNYRCRKKTPPLVERGIKIFFYTFGWRQPEYSLLRTYSLVRIQGLSPGRLTGTVGKWMVA